MGACSLGCRCVCSFKQKGQGFESQKGRKSKAQSEKGLIMIHNIIDGMTVVDCCLCIFGLLAIANGIKLIAVGKRDEDENW